MDQDPRPAQPALAFPYVTVALAVLNVIVFGIAVAAGADPMTPDPDKMFELGANFGPVTLAGEPWRLLTSMFLHYGVMHLAMNMIGLLDGGRHVERMYGRAAYIALYVFAGLAGSLASALSGKAVSAGASGAIFGVFGAFGAFLLLHRDRFDKEQLSRQARGLVIFLAFNIWFGLQAKGIDLLAHLGGLGAGFLAGLILGSDRARVARSIAVGVVGSALLIVGSQLAPEPSGLVVLGHTKRELAQFAALEQQALDRYNRLAEANKPDAEMLNTIETEILPVWRQAKASALAIEGLPPTLTMNLRTYVETRERAFVEIADSLRSQDGDAMKRGMATMREADGYIDKLKP
ncbi:MAG: rhomboid family intramembrane serine protease [Kofleriaceae bacterium]